jgi:hypothetical protein
MWPLYLVVGVPAHLISQSWVYFAMDLGWSWKPVDWAFKVECALDAIERRHSVWYTWLPADSGDPNEIGMHYRSDLLERDNNDEGRRIYPNRPRVFLYSGGGTYTPA